MRFVRFDDNRLGLVDGYSIRDVTPATDSLPPLRWPAPHGDHFIANLEHMRRPLKAAGEAAQRLAVSDVKLLSPVANPPRILAAPINYRAHESEAKDPGISQGNDWSSEGYATPIDKFGLFLKSPTSVVGAGEGIELAFPGRRSDFEIELAVVVGETVRDVPAKSAMDAVAGYCIGLDISLRGTEDRSYRKSADSYTVLGPWLVTADEIDDPGKLELRLAVDGELRQSGNTKDLIVGIPALIERASRACTLYPGDVILTGTPAGVGELRAGMTLRASIDGIGAMDVKVR